MSKILMKFFSLSTLLFVPLGSQCLERVVEDQADVTLNNYPKMRWSRVEKPEDAGWSLEKLAKAKQCSELMGSAAVMIIDDGRVISEWGETTRKFNVHSIRKSFLSALYGIAVAKGSIKLTSTLEKLGIDDNDPPLTSIEKQARVIDLLKARSGIYHPALYETQGMKLRRPQRGSHPPSSYWYYNNWDFNALGTIYETQTGSSLFQSFNDLIAMPLQMEDFTLADTQYIQGPDSVHSAYPFRMTARDMARFGLLYLRGGVWNGKQIIPATWVQESTTAYSVAKGNGGCGYGYLWWVAVNGNPFPNVELEDGSFWAEGFGGHLIVVIPSLNVVIVHRVNTDIKGASVSFEQFGELLHLILQARAP